MREHFAFDVHFEQADLFGLIGGERDAAIDAITAGLEMPYVLIGDEVVCAGDLDADRIAAALRGA